MTISPDYRNHITTQSYEKNPSILGVELVQSNLFGDDSGLFTEIGRLENGNMKGFQEPFHVKQISMSLMVPNTIKAYHIHYIQDDAWFVTPNNRILVNLHDIRENSPTFGVHMKLHLGGCKSQILRIPHGVAHGAANPYTTDQVLIYATTEQFNPAQPDEHRLPWDSFGADVWEITKG